MKRLVIKFGFLMLLSALIFAMPVMASEGDNTSADGCTASCNRAFNACLSYCNDDMPLTDLLCSAICFAQSVVCTLICPVTG